MYTFATGSNGAGLDDVIICFLNLDGGILAGVGIFVTTDVGIMNSILSRIIKKVLNLAHARYRGFAHRINLCDAYTEEQ